MSKRSSTPPVTPAYTQKFRTEWKVELPWIQPVANDRTKAFCIWCSSQLNAKLADLRKHGLTAAHSRAKESFDTSRQPKLKIVDRSKHVERKKQIQGSLALYIAAHGTMNTIDHLSDLCSSKMLDSKEEIKLHRTKCTELIKNVLSPHFQRTLRHDIGDSKFSLILDESTDISVTKLLGIAIRYYSHEKKKVVSTFLELVELNAGTADAIVESIEKVIKKFGLKMPNLVGIGTDNASVMVGVNNGVHAKLRDKYNLPGLVLLRCVCHSLQLAVSAATKNTLPKALEFMIKDTYSWFSHSSLRQSAYTELYKLINDNKAPLKILPLSETRWLAIERALQRILSQWEELETHFEIARRREACYTAEMLYGNYKDPGNRVYLTYVYDIVREVQKTNKIFEAESADCLRALESLQHLIKTIAKKVLIPTAKINIFTEDISQQLDPNPYLGYPFEKAFGELACDLETKKVIRRRCVDFTVKLFTELQNRLPSNLVLLEKMKLLHPSKATKNRLYKLSILDLIKEFVFDDETISKIESQWDTLTNVTWNNVRTSEEFWSEVADYKDALGQNPFQELVNFALSLLSLPVSNAEIERVFSQMNIIKSKLRNRMITSTMNALLDIRYGLKRAEKCCHNYEFPKEVLKDIGTLKAYSKEHSANDKNCQGESQDDADIGNILIEINNSA